MPTSRATRGATPRSDEEASDRILRAALAAFSEKGYEGASTREIARRAEVPLGLLRYYFGDKEKLWRASVDQAFAELSEGFEAAGLDGSGGDDDIARVRAGIRAHVHFVAARPEFVRLMHDEGKRRGPRMRWIVDRHVKPLFARLLPVMQRLQALGRLPSDVDPLHFSYALIGAIDVIFHQAEECKRVTGVDPSEPSAVEAHARVVEHMLLGPPEADG